MPINLGFRFSRGVLSTISPPTPQAYQWASTYVPRNNRPLLDMSQGVPGLPPPRSLQDALGLAASSPSSFGYCPADGEPSLRKALAEEMKTVYGADTDVTREDIALTTGCNMAFVAAIMSLADAGDEVILPVPWYFNHQMSLDMLGIRTVPLHALPEDGFVPSVKSCSNLVTSKTKAIVLVTPNNPTGATYSPALIASFAKLARERNVALIIDETYRDFITTGSPHQLFSPSVIAPWRSTFIHLFSFSKSYCLPGHRLGAIVASPLVLTQIKTVLDCLQICPPRPIQLALAPLLPSLRPFIRETAVALRDRHDLFRRELPTNWVIGAQGGYFAFVKHPFVRISAREVSERLAKQMGVVTLPATFFSDDKGGAIVEGPTDQGRWIRFSVANVDDEKVKKVSERLRESEDVFGWALDPLR